VRIATFSLGILIAAFGSAAAMAAPVSGSFPGVVSAADLATFSGDILGTPASEFHEGNIVSGTFHYDPVRVGRAKAASA
jgi:hypothetical protein